MDQGSIIFEMAKLELDEARQYEAQRERIVTLSIVVTGGLLTAFTLQTGIEAFKTGLAIFSIGFNLIVLGLSWKFYTQFKIRYERYRIYRRKLSGLVHDVDFETVNDEAAENWYGKKGKGFWDLIPLRWAWIVFPSAMLIASLAMLIALIGLR